LSDSFRAFVLDQLGETENVTSRPMFGGTGLYSGTVFFGIIFYDILYFKVNDASRKDYERAGMKPFKPYNDRPLTMQYYEVPAQVLEDGEKLTKWARRAIAIARRAPQKKRARRR
jgi:DNA transformation protein